MKVRHWLIFGLILMAAFGLRWYRLGQVPYGMNWDEVSIAYNAWSISMWHRDEQANLMPLSFKSFGDYKPPGVIYVLALPYWLWGFRLEWVRWLSAAAGVGTVITAYLIAREWGKKAEVYALGVMLVVALSPWAVTLSRVGYEQNTAFFLTNMGVLGLLLGLKNPRWWLWASLPIALSLYTFHTAKIFWLGFLPIFGLIYRRSLRGAIKTVLAAGVLLGMMCLPLAADMIGGGGAARSQTLIWLGSDRAGTELLRNIVNQLSWRFWIGGHDAVSIRHIVPGHGVLTIMEAGLLMIGIIVGLKNLRQPKYQFVMVWWLMGLMPALVTVGTPHALRSLLALTPTAMLVMTGFMTGWQWFIKRSKKVAMVAAAFCLIIYFWQVAGYLKAYFGFYAITSAVSFQYGYEEVIKLARELRGGADKIYMSDQYGQPYIYILAYNRIKPQDFLFGALNDYVFGKIKWQERQPNSLYIGTPEEIPPTDPAVVEVVKIPKTEKIVWVIAKT